MSKLDELMGREMTRRQFLVTVGLGIASIFGLSAVMGALADGGPSAGVSEQPSGYGARDYGH